MELKRIGGICPMETCDLVEQCFPVRVDQVDPYLTVLEVLSDLGDGPFILVGFSEHSTPLDTVHRHFEHFD